MFWRKKRQTSSGVERRKFPRTEVSLTVYFQVLSSRDPETRSTQRKGTLKDISPAGLCFYTTEIIVDGLHISYDEMPREKNQLLFKLVLPPPHLSVSVLGQVVWFERDFLEDTAIFKVGVEFIRFEDQGEEVLRRFLKELS